MLIERTGAQMLTERSAFVRVHPRRSQRLLLNSRQVHPRPWRTQVSGGRVSNPLSGDHSPRCRAAYTTPYPFAREYRRRESNARPPGS